MRLLCVLPFLCAAALSFAQQGDPQSLFRTLRADGNVVVRQHQLGSQVVEITMQAADYPGALLRSQVEDLGRRLGSAPRGLQVTAYRLWPNDPNPPLVRATFAVDGLIDPVAKEYALEPIVRAFAGAAEPYVVKGLNIQFERQSPGRNTLRRFQSKAVIVEASDQLDSNIGIEYRVQLLSQKPDEIVIPSRPEPPAKAKPPAPPKQSDWVLYALLAIGSLALGALVYSLLLRVRPQSPPSPR